MTPPTPPHVGVITTSYPRFDGDVAGIFVMRATRALVERGMRATVVAPRDELPRRTPGSGIEVVEAPVPAGVFYGPGVPERLATRAPELAWRLPLATAGLGLASARALRGCDALIGHWVVPSGPLCALVSAGRPWGLVAHSGGARMLIAAPRPVRALARRLLSGARFVSATEPGLARSLAGVLDREVVEIGPHTAAAALWEVPAPAVADTEPLRLGFLGRRAPIKGLDRLIEATRRARAEQASLTLTVAGPRGDAVVVDEAVDLDLGPVCGDEALRAFFERIDVLVVPSRAVGGRAEGLPCVVVEAWAAGRAVLATDSGGLRHQVPDAWRMPADIDPAGLARRILALGEDRAAVRAECLAGRARARRLESVWRSREGRALDQLLGQNV